MFVVLEGGKGTPGDVVALTALRALSYPLTLFGRCFGLICLLFGLYNPPTLKVKELTGELEGLSRSES